MLDSNPIRPPAAWLVQDTMNYFPQLAGFYLCCAVVVVFYIVSNTTELVLLSSLKAATLFCMIVRDGVRLQQCLMRRRNTMMHQCDSVTLILDDYGM